MQRINASSVEKVTKYRSRLYVRDESMAACVVVQTDAPSKKRHPTRNRPKLTPDKM